VNAGGVYAYVKTSLDQTKYLSELMSGDNVLIVDKNGEAKKGIVGRSKIEKRPLILIEAEVDNAKYSVILQNAETINLVNNEGVPLSVTKLNIGDKVLVNMDTGGRHFGRKIEEHIIEK
jgi:3-dehydroquinate synthase II